MRRDQSHCVLQLIRANDQVERQTCVREALKSVAQALAYQPVWIRILTCEVSDTDEQIAARASAQVTDLRSYVTLEVDPADYASDVPSIGRGEKLGCFARRVRGLHNDCTAQSRCALRTHEVVDPVIAVDL